MQGDEASVPAVAVAMDRVGDKPFAGAGFSQDHNCRIAGGNDRDLIQRVPENWTLADDLLKMSLRMGPTFEMAFVLVQSVPQQFDFARNPRVL